MRTLFGPRSATIFDSTAGAGGFTAGATAPAVNMLEEALVGGGGGGRLFQNIVGAEYCEATFTDELW